MTRNEVLLRGCFTFGLVFLFPAFTIHFAFDATANRFTGSLFLQIVNAGCEILALSVIFSSRSAVALVKQCRTILALIGITFLWAPFSYDPMTTIRAANVLLSSSLFGIAMVARFGPRECLRLIIRTMTLGCLLSIYWVYAYPAEGVHHDFDAFQFQHAGLWRGIFSHKQGLGVFAGLTFGLLLFYGSMTFPSVLVRIGALACSLQCLIGTQSATGMLVAGITPAMLYTTYWIARAPLDIRKAAVSFLPPVCMVVLGGFFAGLFDFIPEMFGKSSDMTGRTEIWPRVMEVFLNSRAVFFGGGFGTGYSGTLSVFSVDNGYIDKIIEFGVVGAVVVFALFLVMLLSAGRLIVSPYREDAAIKIFPFCILFIIFFINISESDLMYKHLCTVLMAVAVAFTTLERIQRITKMPRRFGSWRPGGW